MIKMSEKLNLLFNSLSSDLGVPADILKKLQDIVGASKIIKGEQEILAILSDMIIKTRSSIIIVLPKIIPEILQLVSQHAYQRKAARFMLTTYIDAETYGDIIRKMLALGNVQFRHLAEPLLICACTRDAEESFLSILGEHSDDSFGILSDKPKVYSEIGPFILQRSQPYKIMRVKKKKKEKKKKKG